MAAGTGFYPDLTSGNRGGSRLFRRHSKNVPAQLGPAQRLALSLGCRAARELTRAPLAFCGAGEEISSARAVQRTGGMGQTCLSPRERRCCSVRIETRRERNADQTGKTAGSGIVPVRQAKSCLAYICRSDTRRVSSTALWPGQVRCDQCHRLCSLACPRSPLDLFFPAGHDGIPTFAGLGLDLDSRGPVHWALPHPVRERLCAARVGAHFGCAGLWFGAGCQCQPAEPCAGGTGGKGYLASCLRTSTGEPSGALVPALC